jgi:hypothetical protein
MATYLISSGWSGLLLAVLATLSDPAPTYADEYQDHLVRGAELTRVSHFREALKEFEDAYAVAQVPSLLLSIARLHMQLGDGREALEAYRRYQLAEPSPDLASQRETTAALARLTAMYEPRPAAAPSDSLARLEALLLARTNNTEYDRMRRRNTSLMVGGSILFGFGYAGAFLTGTMYLGLGACSNYSYNYTGSTTNQSCVAANSLLLVPIVGPVIGGLVQPSVVWTIPWLFIDGAAQIGGLAMMIASAKSNHALNQKSSPLANLHLLPYSTPTQSGITLAGRF